MCHVLLPLFLYKVSSFSSRYFSVIFLIDRRRKGWRHGPIASALYTEKLFVLNRLKAAGLKSSRLITSPARFGIGDIKRLWCLCVASLTPNLVRRILRRHFVYVPAYEACKLLFTFSVSNFSTRGEIWMSSSVIFGWGVSLTEVTQKSSVHCSQSAPLKPSQMDYISMNIQLFCGL